ncbi:MAG: Holliday junction resolvase RuvX [Alphaproteobacteria bacterium]|nr:Holliday junction resolvase RuvX [Alphaproteobacteria bacterium]MBV8549021.1 Holliday junction resolvase RuvX [Alphaproteobacteria bacterium]
MAVLTLIDFAPALPPARPLLGLDPGSVVIGVAVSDPMRRVASPLVSLNRAKKFADDAAAIVKIIRERQVGGLVIGLPKNMDGSEGPAAQSARAFARNLVERGGLPDPAIPILFWDERFSSAAVERMLIADDMTRKRRDAVIDKAAAAYILQGALDALGMRQGL